MAVKIWSEELVRKFSHVVESGREGDEKRIAYQRLVDRYHLGRDNDVKDLLTRIFIDICFDEKPAHLEQVVKKLSHYGKIGLDVNGLKAVNDWGSHTKGNFLLERIVCCLINNKAIENFIKHFKLQFPRRKADNEFVFVPWESMRTLDKLQFFYQVFREGGDEFSMVFHCPDRSLNTLIASEGWEKCHPNKHSEHLPLITVFRELIVDRVSVIYIGDLIDYDCIIQNIDDFGLQLHDKAMDKGFKFFASIAGGEVALDYILTEYLENNDVFSVKYTRAYFGEVLMGQTQDYVDKITSKFKARYKQFLMNSKDPCAVFTGYLITRSEETRRFFGVVMKISESVEKTVERFAKSQRGIFQEILTAHGSNSHLRRLIGRASENVERSCESLPKLVKRIIEKGE